MKRGVVDISLLALMHSLQHIYHGALPPLYLLLRAEFSVSTFQIGLIGSVFGFISILQGPAGYLVERFGGKRLSVLSMLGCSAATFLYSLAPSFEFLLMVVAIYAISQVPFHPASYAMVVQRSAPYNRAKYISYHQVGGFFGSAIGTAITAALTSIGGWRTTLQIIPLGGLVIIVIFWKFVEDSANVTLQPIHQSTKTVPSAEKSFHITPPLLVLILGISILSLGTLQQFIPLFLTEAYGESIVWAGIFTSIMQAIGSATSLLGGAMSDKYEKTLIMISAYIGVAITTILLAVGQFSSAVLLLILILYGVTRYFPVPAQHALSSVTAAGHPQGIGFSYTGTAIGQIFSAPLIGYLIDTLGARLAFMICSIFPFLSATIMLIFRKMRSAPEER
jgi:FSR family fosmidomycin resistance protein-like MFS transporter